MDSVQASPPLYRVIIAGCRDFDDYGMLFDILSPLKE